MSGAAAQMFSACVPEKLVGMWNGKWVVCGTIAKVHGWHYSEDALTLSRVLQAGAKRRDMVMASGYRTQREFRVIMMMIDQNTFCSSFQMSLGDREDLHLPHAINFEYQVSGL